MRRKKAASTPNHQIFAKYSLIIAFIYFLRIIFELITQITTHLDVQWQVTECLFVVFGVLISLAMNNAYDMRVSLISICWVLWMVSNTLLALFIINSDIIQMIVERFQENAPFTVTDILKLIIDIIHFFNIPISLYMICVLLVSTKSGRKNAKKSKSRKIIKKKQFEVVNVFVGDEMVYYV